MIRNRTKSLALLLLALCALYTAGWVYMAGYVKNEAEEFIADARADGLEIVSRTLAVRGFPLKHTLKYSGRIAYKGATFEIPVMNVRSFLMPGSNIAITLPQGLRTVDASALPHRLWSADYLKIEGIIPETLPAALYREDLRAWRDNDGKITVNNFRLKKQSLNIKGAGALKLDEALQPAGFLDVRIDGHMEFLGWLQAEGLIETKQALLAGTILSGLSKTKDESDDLYINVSLLIQNRTLFAGPLELFEFPPIDWEWRHRPALPE